MDQRQDSLVRQLVERRLVKSPRVEAALRSVPREAFLPADAQADAYLDSPLPIAEGQTISAPHMVAIMAEALDVHPGQCVLEIGGGSGYHAAVLGRLVAPGGSVLSVERHESLVEEARRNLSRLTERPSVEFVLGDGTEGVPRHAPFDRISVAAAAPEIPGPLLAQLANGGRLVIPVGSMHEQDLLRVTRREDGDVGIEHLGPVRFVPLIGRHGWPE